MIEQIPQLDGESGARARSAWNGYTLCFANISGITFKNQKLVNILSGRVKHSGVRVDVHRMSCIPSSPSVWVG
jgi:hypothetical protein